MKCNFTVFVIIVCVLDKAALFIWKFHYNGMILLS